MNPAPEQLAQFGDRHIASWQVGEFCLNCGCKFCEAMPVAQLTLEIRIDHAQSLKDRRQVVRSLKDQLRQGFNASVAEMDEAVTWQSATIGVGGHLAFTGLSAWAG